MCNFIYVAVPLTKFWYCKISAPPGILYNPTQIKAGKETADGHLVVVFGTVAVVVLLNENQLYCSHESRREIKVQ